MKIKYRVSHHKPGIVQVNIKDLLLFSICFLSIRPDYFLQIKLFSMIYSWGTLLMSIYLIFWLIRDGNFANPVMISLFFMYGWLGIVTVGNGNGLFVFLDTLSLPLFAIIGTYWGMQKDKRRFVQILAWILCTYIVVNFFSIIIFPDGMAFGKMDFVNGAEEKRFFLGQKNTVIKFALLAEFAVVMKAVFEGCEMIKAEKIFGVLVFLTGIFAGSMVSVLASFVPLVFMIIGINRLPDIINPLTAWIMNLVFYVLIIIMRKQEMFAYIIEVILKKNLSFTSRTRLWDAAFELIEKKILTGYGIEEKTDVVLKTGFNNDSFHNFVLDYLYQGGVVVLIIWTAIMVILYIMLKGAEDLKIRKIGNLFTFSYGVVWMSEPFTRSRITTFLIFLIVISVMCQRKKLLRIKFIVRNAS